MRKFVHIFVFVFLCSQLRGQRVPDDAVYVVVNDSVITLLDVHRELDPLLDSAAELYGFRTPAYVGKARRYEEDVVNAQIDRKIILHEFTKAGYNLPESFIDDEINDDIKKNYYGDRAKLIDTLHAQGKSYETYRQQQREHIIVEFLRHEKTSSKKILISPKQIEGYYRTNSTNFDVGEQVKLRMIVIDKTAQQASAQKIAEEVLKKLDEGVSFAEMAEIYSSGPYRTQGGDRGWIDRSKKLASDTLLTTAFSLKAGQHSGIIELPDAYYILQVDDVRPAHVKPLSDPEVRAEIEETLKRDAHKAQYERWISRLRKKVLVDREH